METLTPNRQQIIESIKILPEEALAELSKFVDYLCAKATEKQSQSISGSFLLSVAGLGASSEKDVSERDEAILADEVDPIHGWSLHLDKQV